MSKIIYFGEQVDGYNIPVLNEREVRASAGLLFLAGIISFFNAWEFGNYTYIKIFVTFFTIDFFIRVVINPKFSPILIISRLFIKSQKAEYSGAPQKKFAWYIALAMSTTMFILLVVFNITGMINLIICLICLVFFFLEVAFGICIGCTMYNWFSTRNAQYCPGGTCEIKIEEPILKISKMEAVLASMFAISIIITLLVITIVT